MDVSAQTIRIPLTDLLTAIDSVVAAGKTPLVIDRSAHDSVNTFFSYRSAIMIDGKKMGLDKSMKKIPVPTIMEDARKKLVSAIKYGYPIVIAMTTSITDFATTFNDTVASTEYGLDTSNGQMFLPSELLQQGGKLLITDRFLNGLFRDEEKEAGVAFCRNPDTFNVILTSRFAEEDFEEYLFGNEYGLPKPKEAYSFILIEYPEGEELLA